MKCRVFDLGLIDYSLGRRKQEEVFTGVLSGEFEHGLIICRHYPVITLGRQAKTNEIIASKDTLAIKRIPVYNIERGGHITYHGPGQLTIYPIFNLELLKNHLPSVITPVMDENNNLITPLAQLPSPALAGLFKAWEGNVLVITQGNGKDVNIKMPLEVKI